MSELTGEVAVELVKEGGLLQADLEGGDAFLVQGGRLGVWVWLGRQGREGGVYVPRSSQLLRGKTGSGQAEGEIPGGAWVGGTHR